MNIRRNRPQIVNYLRIGLRPSCCSRHEHLEHRVWPVAGTSCSCSHHLTYASGCRGTCELVIVALAMCVGEWMNYRPCSALCALQYVFVFDASVVIILSVHSIPPGLTHNATCWVAKYSVDTSRSQTLSVEPLKLDQGLVQVTGTKKKNTICAMPVIKAQYSSSNLTIPLLIRQLEVDTQAQALKAYQWLPYIYLCGVGVFERINKVGVVEGTDTVGHPARVWFSNVKYM